MHENLIRYYISSTTIVEETRLARLMALSVRYKYSSSTLTLIWERESKNRKIKLSLYCKVGVRVYGKSGSNFNCNVYECRTDYWWVYMNIRGKTFCIEKLFLPSSTEK